MSELKLTEEEQAALDESEELEEEDDGQDDTDDDGSGEGEGGDDEGAGDDEGEEKGDENEEEGEPGTKADTADQEHERPAYWTSDSDIDLEASRTELEGLNTQRGELLKKLKDGDIELDEFLTQRDEIDDKRSALEKQIQKAELHEEYNEKLVENLMRKDQERFFLENTAFAETESLLAALNLKASKIRQTDEGIKLNQYDLLCKARDLVYEDLGIDITEENKPGKSGGKTSKDKEADEAGKKAANIKAGAAAKAKEAAKRSLSKTSVADDANDDGRFAHLDKMDPQKLEKTLAKMSDADVTAYLEGK